jgi:hypothetical protein
MQMISAGTAAGAYLLLKHPLMNSMQLLAVGLKDGVGHTENNARSWTETAIVVADDVSVKLNEGTSDRQ